MHKLLFTVRQELPPQKKTKGKYQVISKVNTSRRSPGAHLPFSTMAFKAATNKQLLYVAALITVESATRESAPREGLFSFHSEQRSQLGTALASCTGSYLHVVT